MSHVESHTKQLRLGRRHRMGRWLWLPAVVAIGLGSGCKEGNQAGSQTSETTERVYDLHCLGCHGARGEGATGSNIQGLNSSVDQIGTVIAEGVGKMPGFKGHLSDSQIRALAERVKAFKLPQ